MKNPAHNPHNKLYRGRNVCEPAGLYDLYQCVMMLLAIMWIGLYIKRCIGPGGYPCAWRIAKWTTAIVPHWSSPPFILILFTGFCVYIRGLCVSVPKQPFRLQFNTWNICSSWWLFSVIHLHHEYSFLWNTGQKHHRRRVFLIFFSFFSFSVNGLS